MKIEIEFVDPENSKYKKDITDYGIYGKYPIGILNEIEIHFLHYKDNDEALKKWERRKNRINYHNLIIKYNDQNLATIDDIREFSELDFENCI